MNALAVGAFSVASAILLGAFGAHALEGISAAHARYWAIATDYHFVGSFGLVVLGFLQRARPGARGAFALLGLGILLFSGSLYCMALGAPRALGAVTPVGGLCLIAGWTWVGVHALGRRP